MKKTFKYVLFALAAGTMSLGLSSCSSDDDNTTTATVSAGDQLLQSALKSDVNNTINVTYKNLADSAEMLYNALSAMKYGSVTQEQVDAACKAFLGARSNYEKSEAFLLGACSHFSIDPHIDSWPLDLTSLHSLLTSSSSIASASNYDQSLIGFHGIEFILFRDGQNRDATELNSYDTYNKENIDFTSVNGERELEFATAVAEDLKNSVFQLQCSWNSDADASRFSILDDLGKAYTTDLGYSYGYNLTHAGQTGSTYTSIKNAAIAVINGDGGCAGIADEVGNTKINNPYSGADISYIESPYSWNTLTDFQNNIRSIENVWYGGTADNRDESKSFHAYFAKYNSTIGTQVETAITDAIAQIAAIPYPFVENYTNEQCQTAITACKTLKSALDTAAQYIESSKD